MGGVDLANQYRAAYETHKSVFRSWFCIFTALLDIVIVNSYRMSRLAAEKRGVPRNRLPEHAIFRETLFRQLFKFSDSPQIQMLSRRWHAKPPPSRTRTRGLHEWETRPKRSGCIQCRIDIGEEKKKITLGQPVIHIPHKTIAGRATATFKGCKQCKVPICTSGDCWKRFHLKS